MSYKGKIIILSGPSGSGKTTLYKKLLLSKNLKGKLVKSISATTRPRRQGEKNGRDYIFLSKKEFLEEIKAGGFLEYEKVFDNYYGTPQKSVDKILKSGRNVLLCIDIKGARTVNLRFSGVIKIFVKTPNLQDLRGRLKGRGSEGQKSLAARLQRAKEELKEAPYYDYVVVNGDFLIAYKKLEGIIRKELGIPG